MNRSNTEATESQVRSEAPNAQGARDKGALARYNAEQGGMAQAQLGLRAPRVDIRQPIYAPSAEFNADSFSSLQLALMGNDSEGAPGITSGARENMPRPEKGISTTKVYPLATKNECVIVWRRQVALLKTSCELVESVRSSHCD
jgi:hypothetical protein